MQLGHITCFGRQVAAVIWVRRQSAVFQRRETYGGLIV